MRPLRLLISTAFALLLAAAGPVLAADATFPQGLRVGLTPLVGLAPSKTFPGFESEDHSVKVLVAELPAGAYGEVKAAFSAGTPAKGVVKPESIETAAGTAYYTIENAKNGATSVRRYSMILSGGTFSGYVSMQVPEDATKIYTDDAVRKMFASATVRKEVPVTEQLGLLPFKLADLANFKNVRTIAPGAAVVLTDGDETTGLGPKPYMLIGVVAAAPQEPDDRARFAQEVATQIPGVRDARITMAEPIRINGTPAYETRIDGTSGKDNTKVTVVQWFRFGSGSSLRIVGSAPRDQWSTAFPRFRAVRDGIQPKG